MGMFCKKRRFFRVVCGVVSLCVFAGGNLFAQQNNPVGANPCVRPGQTRGSAPASNLLLPSAPYDPPVLRGIKINPRDPLKLEFIIDTQDKKSVSPEEADRLINYFLACLAIPEDDLWVNLSPYEQDRIISEQLSYTDLGRDMLAQDYILKQLAASLTYPETETGKRYWDEINNPNRSLSEPRPSIRSANGRNTQGAACIETTQSLNKVWIIPDKADIYVKGNAAFITDSRLKVMMEEDYLAGRFDTSRSLSVPPRAERIETNGTLSDRAIQSFKTHILPQITQQVNHGEHFAQLRQVYNSFILAVWFKHKMQDSIFQYYIGQKKITGIDINDKNAKQKIYKLYLEAFTKGAYNYVKKDRVGANNHSPVQKITRRQYFSGGVQLDGSVVHVIGDAAALPALVDAVAVVDGLSMSQPQQDQRQKYDAINQEIEEAFTFLVRDYSAMLDSNKAEELAELVVSPGGDIAEREKLLVQFKNPPFDWFVSYFQGIDDADLLRMFDRTHAVNVNKGCSVQCDCCYANADKKVRYMAWPYMVEIAARLRRAGITPTVHYYDSDPLRDYYDPVYKKNYADIVNLFEPIVVTTAGFDIGSVGEAAARQIKKEHPYLPFRVSIKIETHWYRTIGKEAYIKAMKNVIGILRPNEISLLFYATEDAKAKAEAVDVFTAIVGHPPLAHQQILPNREGRAEKLVRPGRLIPRYKESIQQVFGFMLEPYGMISKLEPQGQVHSYELVRKSALTAQHELWGRIEARLREFNSSSAKAPGGVKLSSKNMDMRVNGNMKFDVSPQLLEQFKNAKGLKHNILLMQRGVDIKKFLEIVQ